MTNISERSLLPKNIVAANRVSLPANSNVFINDTTNVDSFRFLAPLIARLRFSNRYIEVWEQEYLTSQLATLLLSNLDDLTARVILPVPGCGEFVALSLQETLARNYGVYLPVISSVSDVPERPVIIVDDVVKTGKTLNTFVPRDLLTASNTVFATWACPAINTQQITNPQFDLLQRLLSSNQLFVSNLYSAAETSILGVPVNSISTLIDYSRVEKQEAVLKSLADKYFGYAIYEAVNLLIN